MDDVHLDGVQVLADLLYLARQRNVQGIGQRMSGIGAYGNGAVAQLGAS